MATCKCGCGCETKPSSSYLPGHDVRMRETAKAAWRTNRDASALSLLRQHNWLDNVKDMRTFGVEIELLVPVEGFTWTEYTNTSSERYHAAQQAAASKLETALEAAGIEASWAGYTHETRTFWKIVTDSSVRSNKEGSNLVGLELVSPILSSKTGREEIRKVCAALQTLGVKVNRFCGLHIHHGAKDLSLSILKRLAQAYGNYQTTINGLVAESRVHNTFCMPLSGTFFQDLSASETMTEVERRLSRYWALNLSAYVRHGTVEFRQHQGTIEAEKILAWLDLGQAMIRAAKRGDSLTTDLADYTEMGSTRMAWWESRKTQLRRVA